MPSHGQNSLQLLQRGQEANVLDGFGELAAFIQNPKCRRRGGGRRTYAAIRAIVAETRATLDVRVRQARDLAEEEVTAAQAIQTADGLAAAEVRCGVMGGWGIDVLVGEQTRAHHDWISSWPCPTFDRRKSWLREAGSPSETSSEGERGPTPRTIRGGVLLRIPGLGDRVDRVDRWQLLRSAWTNGRIALP